MYDKMCQWLIEGWPFAFSRFGDGEWSCVLGEMGANADGVEYSPSLARRLRDILKQPQETSYLFGMQNKAQRDMGPRINRWMAENNVTKQWIDADIFHDASERVLLKEFFDSLCDRRVIVVGPYWLIHMKRFINYAHHIIVPQGQAWRTYFDILDATENVTGKDDVVLVSAGMAGKGLVDDLWENDSTILDMGSVFDVYCGGRCTRRYHHKVLAKLARRDK